MTKKESALLAMAKRMNKRARRAKRACVRARVGCAAYSLVSVLLVLGGAIMAAHGDWRGLVLMVLCAPFVAEAVHCLEVMGRALSVHKTLMMRSGACQLAIVHRHVNLLSHREAAAIVIDVAREKMGR